MESLICIFVVYEGNLTTDALNEILDCENNVRKLLMKNNERIILEGERNTVHLLYVIYIRCTQLFQNETELMKLIEIEGF